MKRNICRFVCVFLCLILLPLSSLADIAFNYDISFDMNAAAYPARDQEVLVGVADLLNILNLNGSFSYTMDNWLDLNGSFVLDHDEATRTTYRIWGPASHWGVNCSLLGNTKLVLNHESLLEFALKSRSWLGLPLHTIAPIISPFSWYLGLRMPDYIVRAMFGGEQTTRLITEDYIRIEAEYIAENLTSDPSSYNLIEALFIDMGIDSFVLNFFDDMPAWLDTFLDDKGLQITIDENGHETWTTGDCTLFERIPTESGYTFTVDLPMTTDDWKLDADGYADGDAFSLHLLLIDEFEDTEVDATLTVTGWPAAFPFNGTCTAELSVDGYAFANACTYSFEAECSDTQLTLSQLDGLSGEKMLTITMAMEQIPAICYYYSVEEICEDAVDILSINDESLNLLVNEVKDHFLDAILPILVKLPSTSYQTVFSLLDQYGILQMLTSGAGMD